MKKDSIYQKKWGIAFLAGIFLAIFLVILLANGISFQGIEGGYVECSINGKKVGAFHTEEELQSLLQEVRLDIAEENGQLPDGELDVTAVHKNSFFARMAGKKKTKKVIKECLETKDSSERHQAYIVKINEYTVTLASKEEVTKLLNATVDKYDDSKNFTVELEDDSEDGHKYHARLMEISRGARDSSFVTLNSGIGSVTDELQYGDRNVTNEEEGTVQADFDENIEVLEGYAPENEIVSLEDAIEDVTKDKESNQTYEIQSGDSLSVIAYQNDTTMESIVALNEDIKDENSVIKPGQEIIISVPEPELSVITKVQESYVEEYQADTVYVDNDSWYTNQMEVRQEATTGKRDVVAAVTYRNGKEVSREIIKETVEVASKPAIIEKGTIVPPTYIKPLYGGVFTSGFKYRWGRWHKGNDYACPVGTSIMASNGGVVSAAGWSNGYGYCVRIQHADGRETRYGHLSKILVKAGQHVKQGEKIALSGNTGRSTGPHVHFEILINGVQVDPLKYMN